jgi:hypothetical protein
MTNNNEYGVNETFRWEDNLKIKSAQELLAITDPEKAQEAMLQWAERYSDSEISRLWKTRELTVSKLRTSLGLKKDRWQNLDISKDFKWPPPAKIKRMVFGEGPKRISPASAPAPVEKREESVGCGFRIQHDGIFSAQEISDRMQGILNLILATPDSKYKLEIKLQEIK